MSLHNYLWNYLWFRISVYNLTHSNGYIKNVIFYSSIFALRHYKCRTFNLIFYLQRMSMKSSPLRRTLPLVAFITTLGMWSFSMQFRQILVATSRPTQVPLHVFIMEYIYSHGLFIQMMICFRLNCSSMTNRTCSRHIQAHKIINHKAWQS